MIIKGEDGSRPARPLRGNELANSYGERFRMLAEKGTLFIELTDSIKKTRFQHLQLRSLIHSYFSFEQELFGCTNICAV